MTGVTYYEHKENKHLYQGLQRYLEDHPKRIVNGDSLDRYRNHLLKHFVQDPANLFAIAEPCDGEYPTDAFLISLHETDVPMSTPHEYHRLMETVWEAWNCNYGSVERKGNTYTFYTGGWSGNEDILDAMFSNVSIWVFIKREWSARCPAVVRIRYALKQKRNRK